MGNTFVTKIFDRMANRALLVLAVRRREVGGSPLVCAGEVQHPHTEGQDAWVEGSGGHGWVGGRLEVMLGVKYKGREEGEVMCM